MTYNVENLFDHKDDPGKEDETYLPLKEKNTKAHRMKCKNLRTNYYRRTCLTLDWSEEVVKTKLRRLADTILQVNDGSGPDFLFLQEVENVEILERLRLEYLKGSGYKKAILVEGPDARGIDVAILAKLDVISSPKLHPITVSLVQGNKKRARKKALRGILQARFKLFGDHILNLYAVHFPSQGSPTPFRVAALKSLQNLVAKQPANEFSIAAGDFNITKEEDQKNGLFGVKLQKQWLVSHKMGCKACKGTHNYRGNWSFLDVILFSKKFEKGPWQWDPKSLRVISGGQYQKSRSGRPRRFDSGVESRGVSDHFPLATQIFYSVPKTQEVR